MTPRDITIMGVSTTQEGVDGSVQISLQIADGMSFEYSISGHVAMDISDQLLNCAAVAGCEGAIAILEKTEKTD